MNKDAFPRSSILFAIAGAALCLAAVSLAATPQAVNRVNNRVVAPQLAKQPAKAMSIFIPTGGDTTPAKALVHNVLVPNGSNRPPRGPIRSLALSATPHFTLPFECQGTDACAFNRLPYYNQLNPNLAFTNVPPTYPAFSLDGVVGWSSIHGLWMMTLASGGLDRFYDSWLPYGPVPGDAGAIYPQHWFSVLCGPTSQAMLLTAALAAKSPTTFVRPGSWTSGFVNPSPPPGQTVVQQGGTPGPQPANQAGPSIALDAAGNPETFIARLKTDNHTFAPNLQQMTQQDVQRVINMAILQRTDPTTGGGFNAMGRVVQDFSYWDPAHPNGPQHPVAKFTEGSVVSPRILTDLIRQRYAVLLGVQWFTAHVAHLDPGGAAERYELSFTYVEHSGHALALEGFVFGNSGRPMFMYHDPIYANRSGAMLILLSSANQRRNGKPMAVSLPGSQPDGYLMNYDYGLTSVAGIDNIVDGQEVVFANYYSALWLE